MFGGFNVSPLRWENCFSLSLLPFTINYSTGSSAVMPVIKYNNADLDKLEILKENKGKYDVYRCTNLVNGKNYVGSSTNLERRLINYFTIFLFRIQYKKKDPE